MYCFFTNFVIFFPAPLLWILCLVNDSKSLPASLHILSISFLGDLGGNLEEFLQDQIDGLKYKLTYLLLKNKYTTSTQEHK